MAWWVAIRPHMPNATGGCLLSVDEVVLDGERPRVCCAREGSPTRIDCWTGGLRNWVPWIDSLGEPPVETHERAGLISAVYGQLRCLLDPNTCGRGPRHPYRATRAVVGLWLPYCPDRIQRVGLRPAERPCNRALYYGGGLSGRNGNRMDKTAAWGPGPSTTTKPPHDWTSGVQRSTPGSIKSPVLRQANSPSPTPKMA